METEATNMCVDTQQTLFISFFLHDEVVLLSSRVKNHTDVKFPE